MTGAGFGGCAVALVEESAVQAFIQGVSAAYQEETGMTPKIYICSSARGVELIY